MKRSFLALAAIALFAVSGVFATQKSPAKQKNVTDFTYYSENACNVEILCSTDFEGPSCEEAYLNTVLYYQPGCSVLHQVAIPQGKLPAH